jgi:phosphoribosylanthranilate isomerase
MRVKICGITQPDHAQAIAQLGATDLGFICVPSSPRYIDPHAIQAVICCLRAPSPNWIGVFANADLSEIQSVLAIATLSGIQLHGDESPAFCQQLKAHYPHLEIIKALRVRTPDQLANLHAYAAIVDTFLLDAFHPQQLGGTGQTLDWQLLNNFHPDRPWFLAGGLTPDNVQDALKWVHPSGIDISSGVETSPGHKDLEKVAHLFNKLNQIVNFGDKQHELSR